ncbi:ATP-binding cassette domain-containing protein [Tenacibaculum maritimum]
MVVSHDRYFMDKIVDSLFVFRGNGVVENFPGNYSDFRTYEDSKPKESSIEKKSTDTRIKESKKGKLSFQENREFGKLEKGIEKLQKKKEAIENQFANGEIEADKINEKSIELQEIISNLEEKEERWFELSMKLEGA